MLERPTALNKLALKQKSETDHQLVVRVVTLKDSDAFGELVRRHQSHVRNFLRKLTANFSLADDLAQDCFLQAWKKMHTYTGQGSLIGWLMKIAYTTFLQSKRKSNRYSQILDIFGQQEQIQQSNSQYQFEDQSDLDKYLSVLKEQERAIMILSYSFGLSHREISDAVRLPSGTIKSIIYRAKQKIRESFDLQAN